MIYKIIRYSALLVCVVLVSFFAYSQEDIERSTKEVDRPFRQEAADKIEAMPEEVPEIKEEKEEEVEEKGPTFFISKIQLIGCETFSADEFTAIIEEYENLDVSLEELTRLTKKIEREYLRRGVIAACVVAPQEIEGGIVKLMVVEARMGILDLKKNKFFNDKKTLSYWKIKPGKIIEYYKISQSLQLMNRNSDREVKATLYAGKEKGTTDVLLDSYTHFPVHLTGSFDREGSVSTGRYRTGFGVRHNNFLGLDDTLLTGYVMSDHSGSLYAYHSIPVSTFGTSFMYGFIRAEAFPKKDFERMDIRSYAKGVSAFIYQDLFRKDNYMGEIYFGFDGKDKAVYTNAGVLNRDRLRVVRFGTNVFLKGPGTAIYLKPEISQGLNIFGAKRRSELASRGAVNTFTKFSLSLKQRIALPLKMQLHINSSAQFATELLMPQEQFALGGIGSVRGYPSGDFYADNGVQTSVELLVPPAFLPDSFKLPFAEKPIREQINGVFFFDHGYGVRRGRIQGERNDRKLASAGVGFKIHLYDQVYIRLAWGVPLPMGDEPISEIADSRFHFSVEVEDKMLSTAVDKITKTKQ